VVFLRIGMDEKLSGKKHDDIYCLVPFGQMSTKPNGSLRPCCASGDRLTLNSNKTREPLNLNREKISEGWNAEGMVRLRKKFLAGQSDPGCSECIANENIGKKSTRLWKNESWSSLLEKNIIEAKENDSILKENGPISLELRLGNLCNLNCRMCNPIFSSRWKSDLENDRTWKESSLLNSVHSQSLEVSRDQGDWYQKKEFWDDVLSYASGLKSLYLSGGEPLIIEELIPFLDKLSQINPNIKIRLDTNLMQFPKETFEILSRFKEVALGASIDAIGKALEFIRNGSSEKVIIENLLKILDSEGNFKVNLSVTYMALNALELYDLFGFYKAEQFKGRININMDILYEPSCLSVKCLPSAARDQAIIEIKKIGSDFDSLLSSHEKRNLDSIYNYLSEVEQGSTQALIEYNNWLDKLHGKSVEDHLPKLSAYLTVLKTY
jgi:organic radical activating enzyme